MIEKAYIAFGSNLGDRERAIRRSLKILNDLQEISLSSVSPIYETEAEGFAEPTPPFLNGVAELDVRCAPGALLGILLDVETQCGRVRTSSDAFQSRDIDLDLLIYGNETIQEPDLIVPHPRMLERWFVLAPFADISPNLSIPGAGKTIARALDSLVRNNVAPMGKMYSSDWPSSFESK